MRGVESAVEVVVPAAINPESAARFAQDFNHAAANSSRVIVLVGAGDVFCRGMQPSSPDGAELREHLQDFAECLLIMRFAHNPVVAVVNGVAIGGGIGLALSVLLVAFIAPIAEELAFRGVILQSVGARWGQWPAIVVSAMLFAAYHVNLWLFLPMFALGAALAWLAVTRRSLWPAIAMHVLYNSLAVAAAFLVPR